MDVSDWTIAQRMKLPDWCFGSQRIVSASMTQVQVDTWTFGISDVVLPDPICIYRLLFFFKLSGLSAMTFRVGLRSTVPTTDAQMNSAAEIFPDMGRTTDGPNKMGLTMEYSIPAVFEVRKGLATGGLKIVAGLYSNTIVYEAFFALVFSELPTIIPAWLVSDNI